MTRRLYRGFCRFLISWMPSRVTRLLVPRCRGALRNHLEGELTEEFLLAALYAMEFLSHLSRGYRANLCGFTGSCVFQKEGDPPLASAVFSNGAMTVVEGRVRSPDTTVTFRSYDRVWSMLLQDDAVVDAILEDAVMVEGNLNYVYRFGLLGSDLKHRLHLP
jgi:hypothetical protein